MEDRLSFGKIHIVEWLKRGERRTGHEVFMDLRALLRKTNSHMPVILHRVSSRGAFLARLNRIKRDFIVTRRVPLIHIDTHGQGDDGIGSSDDDGLTWPELMAALVPLNETTGVRLVLVLAACEGIWGIKMAQPMERSPFLALIGQLRCGQVFVRVADA